MQLVWMPTNIMFYIQNMSLLATANSLFKQVIAIFCWDAFLQNKVGFKRQYFVFKNQHI